ncbi:MAG: MFS transporter [Candidatus Pacebacteria bacterium]|nr:MFS transporter [Candidatus Paceibacterota bacterium]
MKTSLEKKYFDGDISRDFITLYKSKAIIYIAMGLLGLYLPIFLYNLFGQNFQTVAWYYLIGCFMYGMTVMLGAQYLNKFGFRKALRTATFFGVLYYTLFYFTNAENFKILIPLTLIALLFYRLFYWIPYHVDFAKFTDKKNRGREISMLGATKNVAAIFTPLLAGFLIVKFSFSILFLIAIILYLLSIIPLFKISRTKEKFVWTVRETWQHFFSKERRREVLAFMADGAEGIIGILVWPIFMFQILNGDYLKLGAIATVITGITIFLQLIIGHYSDSDKKIGKKHILRFGSAFYALGWILKIFIATAFQIFIIDSYHKLMKIFMRIPFDAMVYEKAADEDHFIDEFTVIREMAVHIGRVIMLCFVIIISPFVSIQWIFILGAIAALSFNFLRMEKSAT